MNIQDFIKQICKETGVPYLDVVCYQNHQRIYRQIVGCGATGNEKLRMFSCGKPITVIAAARLISEGKLGLDDAVMQYLPEVQNAFVLDERGGKNIVGDKMTVRHLFTMTAGFTYDVATEPVLQTVRDYGGVATLRDMISAFVKTPLSFTPGEKFRYSLCHDVLAAVVEVVANCKFSDYVSRVIFAPLGMKNSNFCNQEEGLSDCYIAGKDGKIVLFHEGNHLVPCSTYESGGAGLIGTVEDYALFADALACDGIAANGYQLIDKKTLKEVRSEQIGSIAVNNNFTCVQGDEYGYGLGVRVRKVDTPWGLKVGEYGWDGAAGAYLLVDPERQISVVMGMHLMGWPTVFTGKHLEIVKRLYQEFFNVK